ncbi:MAG: hypothetical protein CSA23_03015 [Deltaproteobacteria bacterium]|nr:MAG: hypothetical protein CSA23_03015 [Deltaproteobacteria bacterium]
MKKLKICLVNADFLPSRGSGQAVYAEKLAAGLAEKHDVIVVTARIEGAPLREKIGKFFVERIPAPKFDPSKWIGFGYQAAAFLHNQEFHKKYDIIHFLDAHVAYAYKGPFVATLHQSFHQRITGDKGLPYASSMQNLIKRYPYYQLSHYLEFLALRKANACIAVSDATREAFAQHYRFNPSKIHRVYNGIDVNRFRPMDTAFLRQKYHLKNEKIILYIGFSTPRKSVETLTHALRYLKTKKVKLVIVGKWEGGYRDKVFKGLGKERNQIVETGYVPDHEIPAYYSLADIFVLPSLLEGFGFPLVEAMACGTPVIGTDVGAIPEIIRDCGIIVSPQRPTELAEKIDLLLNDRQLQTRLITKGMNRVLSNFTQSGMIRDTLHFYRKTVAAYARAKGKS